MTSELLQLGNRREDNSSSDLNAVLTDVSSCKVGTEVNRTFGALRSSLENVLPHLDSAPRIAQDRLFSKSQTTDKELVVEVLVHSGLGRVKINESHLNNKVTVNIVS